MISDRLSVIQSNARKQIKTQKLSEETCKDYNILCFVIVLHVDVVMVTTLQTFFYERVI